MTMERMGALNRALISVDAACLDGDAIKPPELLR
jgi:hypothetical protein